jgi:SAM-dependent methyltransferase
MDETQRGFWDCIAPTYGKVGPPIFAIAAQRLLQRLPLEPGDKLLDVACGTGAVAIPAAKRVGQQGQVIATDLSPAMVAQAQEQAKRCGLDNMAFAVMDALSLEYLNQQFDAVTSGFALFFFPDMKKALSEMHRTLKPQGVLGLSLWGKGAIVPIWPILGETLKKHGVPPPVPNPVAWTKEGIGKLLASVGFHALEIIEERYGLSFRDAQEALDFTLSIGPLDVALNGIPGDRRRAFTEEFTSLLQALATAEGLAADFRVLYAIAKKERE